MLFKLLILPSELISLIVAPTWRCSSKIIRGNTLEGSYARQTNEHIMRRIKLGGQDGL
jgi:hypothetical protein